MVQVWGRCLGAGLVPLPVSGLVESFGWKVNNVPWIGLFLSQTSDNIVYPLFGCFTVVGTRASGVIELSGRAFPIGPRCLFGGLQGHVSLVLEE